MSVRTASTLLGLLRPRDLSANSTYIDGNNDNPFVICVADSCACDWRVTVHDCNESDFLFVVYQFGMWIGCLSLIFGLVVLIYRRFWLGHRFLLPRGSEEGMRLKSIINPRPVEVYLICVVLHLVGRTTFISLTLYNALSSSLWKEFLQELPWEVAFNGVVLYLIGVIVPQKRLTPSYLSDIMAIGFTIPINVSTLLLAALSGYYRDQGQIALANTILTAHYIIFGIACIGLVLAFFYFMWYRLRISVMEYIRCLDQEGSGEERIKILRLKEGLVRMRAISIFMIVVMIFFAVALISFGQYREQILTSDRTLTHILAIGWVCLTPVMMLGSVLLIALATTKQDAHPINFITPTTSVALYPQLSNSLGSAQNSSHIYINPSTPTAEETKYSFSLTNATRSAISIGLTTYIPHDTASIRNSTDLDSLYSFDDGNRGSLDGIVVIKPRTAVVHDGLHIAAAIAEGEEVRPVMQFDREKLGGGVHWAPRK